MRPEEIYLAWAPAGSKWSPWAIPVPFAQIVCVPTDAESELRSIEGLAAGLESETDLAVVIDLPGEQSARLALSLAMRGFRPVPVIDGSPGPNSLSTVSAVLLAGPSIVANDSVAVDMRQLVRWLCIGATALPSFNLQPNARPVFLLDSMRTGSATGVGSEIFDNRWKAFPQDFPSARFLKEQGIGRVLLIQASVAQPCEDLAHVLLRWQEEGIAIHAASADDVKSRLPIQVYRPNSFRKLWYRMLALIGLKRSMAGGFGGWPQGSGGG